MQYLYIIVAILVLIFLVKALGNKRQKLEEEPIYTDPNDIPPKVVVRKPSLKEQVQELANKEIAETSMYAFSKKYNLPYATVHRLYNNKNLLPSTFKKIAKQLNNGQEKNIDW